MGLCTENRPPSKALEASLVHTGAGRVYTTSSTRSRVKELPGAAVAENMTPTWTLYTPLMDDAVSNTVDTCKKQGGQTVPNTRKTLRLSEVSAPPPSPTPSLSHTPPRAQLHTLIGVHTIPF
jgi:hypothetical protein